MEDSLINDMYFVNKILQYDTGFLMYVTFSFQFLNVKTLLSNFMSESEGLISHLGL